MDQDLYEALLTLHPWAKDVPSGWQDLSDEALTETDLGQIIGADLAVQNYYALRTGAFYGSLTEEELRTRREEQAVAKASYIGEAAASETWNNPEASRMWQYGLTIGMIIAEERRHTGLPPRPVQLQPQDHVEAGSNYAEDGFEDGSVESLQFLASEVEVLDEAGEAEVEETSMEDEENPSPSQEAPVVVEWRPSLPAAPAREATAAPEAVSRRDFLKGAIASGVAVLGGAYLLFGRGAADENESSEPVAFPGFPTETPAPVESPTPSPEPTSVPAPAPGTVLYETDWSDGGSDGWEFPARWGLLNGALTIPESSAFTGPQPFVVVPVLPTHPDYAIEVEWQWLEDHGFGHLLFLVIRERYVFMLEGQSHHQFSISAMKPDQTEVRDSSNAFARDSLQERLTGDVHTVRFEGKGKTLSAYIDGRLLLQAIGDNEYVPGRTGLSGFHKSEVRSLRIVAT